MSLSVKAEPSLDTKPVVMAIDKVDDYTAVAQKLRGATLNIPDVKPLYGRWRQGFNFHYDRLRAVMDEQLESTFTDERYIKRIKKMDLASFACMYGIEPLFSPRVVMSSTTSPLAQGLSLQTFTYTSLPQHTGSIPTPHGSVFGPPPSSLPGSSSSTMRSTRRSTSK